jgi:hypothetical protein
MLISWEGIDYQKSRIGNCMVREQVGVRERKRGREVSRKTSEYQQWHKKAQEEQ